MYLFGAQLVDKSSLSLSLSAHAEDNGAKERERKGQGKTRTREKLQLNELKRYEIDNGAHAHTHAHVLRQRYEDDERMLFEKYFLCSTTMSAQRAVCERAREHFPLLFSLHIRVEHD